MEDYKRQAKIEALNKAFPGKFCGNPRCEERCAEADMLGCRVKLYEEQINAQGRRPWIKKDPFEFQNGFIKPKCQIYYPQD